jgi:predicted Zn-ribbon and HTH transcriptional regulator
VETIWTATLATLQTTGEKEQPTTLSEALNKAGSDELEQLATDIQTAVQTVMLGEGALDKLFAVTHTPMNTDETETRIEPLMTNAQKMLDTLREDVKAAHDQDREDLQEHVNKIQDALRRIDKLTQVSPGATEEIAYHDAKDSDLVARRDSRRRRLRARWQKQLRASRAS